MPINVNDFANADSAFREQIKVEMQRATENLNRIATLFQVGLADRQVLKEFREAVDRVREAGWIAQQGLDAAQSQKTTEMLFAHRARAAISLLKQLRLELERMDPPPAALPELLEAGSAFHEAANARGAAGRREK
jgi:multidrug resistance efflux pump